jgi:dephospho-CoA kinase
MLGTIVGKVVANGTLSVAPELRMVVIGLTGSLGMGKTVTAGFFAEEGVPVYDADRAVHRLYGGEAAPLIEAAFPGTTGVAGVDRQKLSEQVLHDPTVLPRLEALIHPLVERDELRFLQAAEQSGVPVVVLDIPLLFETDAERRVDAVVVVTAPAQMQRARAFERPGMTEEKFLALLAKQAPDAEKRRRADFIVDTSKGFDSARQQVRAILRQAPSLPIRRRYPNGGGR